MRKVTFPIKETFGNTWGFVPPCSSFAIMVVIGSEVGLKR